MTSHDDAPGEFAIEQDGRGGTIRYREGAHALSFDWELALPPAVVLIFGPNAAAWDARVPWAAGRQRAIYERVGADVVTMQVPGGSYVLDLDAGVIEIMHPSGAAPAPAPSPPALHELERIALDTLEALEDGDAARGIVAGPDATSREVDALAPVDTPAARAALEAALHHHLSIETRLAAADVLARRDPAFELDDFLALQIRRIHRTTDGLARALRLAEQRDTPTIRQALLWASYNGTECAPAFAALLLRLNGTLPDPIDEATTALLAHLDVHNSSFARKAAFDELCTRVGMELDTDVAY